MESLIIIILFLALSSISGSKRNRRRQPARPNQQPNVPQQPSLTGQIRQLFDEVMQNDASSRRSANAQRRARQAAQTAASECEYCTGEVEVAQSVEHRSELAPMHALVPQNDVPVVDVKAVQQKMGLSDLQNAIFWQEVLAKPPALRGNRRR